MTNDASHDAPAPIERRLATILCADVAGYSQMMGANEERTVQVFRGHRQVFESLVTLHRGRIFNTAGDALLVEFASAVEAVRCATEIQAALRTRNDHLPPEERMQFRIGINVGDVVVQGDDLLGDGVNVAARIQTATEPGGIRISGSVFDQIQNKLSLDFKLLGEQVYKNIARPVRTYTVVEGVPAGRAAMRAPAWRRSAAIGAAVVAIASAGYWGYLQYEARHAEQARAEALAAAQKRAAEQAQRAAADARQLAESQAQKLASGEALRRTQEERKQLEQDRLKLEAERRAAEASRRQAAEDALRRSEEARRKLDQERQRLSREKEAAEAKPPTQPPVAAMAPRAGTQHDGRYEGQLCNKWNAQCWPVALVIRDGLAEGSWLSGSTKKTATARGDVTAEGAVQLTLATWTPDGRPAQAELRGRVVSGAINVSGSWNTGGQVAGNWTRVQTASATAGKPRPAAPHDGWYDGQFCNQFKSKPAECWNVPLHVRGSAAEGGWISASTKRTATARGTIAADGTVQLTMAAWGPDGKPVQALVRGRLAEGRITVSGQWDGGLDVTGNWKRQP